MTAKLRAPPSVRLRRGRCARARALRAAAGRPSSASTRAARASSTTCPAALPGLLLARKVQRRAAAVGFEYRTPRARSATSPPSSPSCGRRRRGARRRRPSTGATARCAHEAGDLLFAAVNVARRWNVDPELAVRAAAARFRERGSSAPRRSRRPRDVDFAVLGLDAAGAATIARQASPRRGQEASR